MSDSVLSVTQLASVLDAIGGEGSRGEIEAEVERRELGPDDAVDAVEAAIADGLLVETDDSGNFPIFRPSEGRETDSLERNPQGEDGENADANPETDGSRLDDGVATVAGTVYPDTIAKREYWVTWILDGAERKRPVAPWETGHAYPVEWRGDLPDEDRPETDFDTAKRWADFRLGDADLSLPDDAASDSLRLGVILPNDRPPRDERVVLIDWDDVRDPETGEIHPVAAEYIDEYGGYVEVSRSGEGLHQYVLGGLRKRGKFIAPIDDEAFVPDGDDLPQVEIYDGGRHVAMTGQHVAGSDADAVEGQPLIDALVTKYADAELDAGHRVRDPETGQRADESAAEGDDSEGSDGTNAEGAVPDPTPADYEGPDLDTLRAEAADRDRSLGYHAVVRAFADGYAGVLNWRLEGAAAAIGACEDRSAADVLEDLETPHGKDRSLGYDRKTAGRVEYDHDRARRAEFSPPSWKTLVAWGVLPPEVVDKDSEDYETDPRTLEATVDARRAWAAAGRVTPDETDSDALTAASGDSERFACPTCGEAVDVVRAVAIDAGLADKCEEDLGDAYPQAYRRAREDHGAPLPDYYTTADAIAEFDALLDVIGEVDFFDLDTDALASEITERGDDLGGDAVRALNPAWRDSESEASVLVFETGTVWDADSERVLDALRFVALDSGLINSPSEALESDRFTAAYRRCRRDYGAPLPRWDPATDGGRDLTPQLPPSEDLVDGDVDGVDPDALEKARDDVEALIREATAGAADTPTVVTALPATGKTTGTVKTARNRALSYLAPRKELQQQALEKADRWGVNAQVLPVFSEERVRDDVLGAAVSHVREESKERLRDRWAILAAAFDGLEGDDAPDPGDIFDRDDEDTDGDDVDLDRPTCETAEGDHGVAWALAVHVARRLGYTPREIHTQARGLFGAELPCTSNDSCEYGDGWDAVADADDPPDLLVGSYVHAHVESVRTAYSRGPDGRREKAPRAVVLDEFPGEAFVREFDEEALDFATWLAGCLREDVNDRRDMYDADLDGDERVRAWLQGEADESDAVGDAIGTLARAGDLLEVRREARDILDEVDAALLEDLGIAAPLRAVEDPERDPAGAYEGLQGALQGANEGHPAYGIVRWATEEVLAPLGDATLAGADSPTVEGVDTDALPIDGDLAGLVDRAVEAAEGHDEGAEGALRAAVTALQGGREGCRRLAAWADDGYAHPDAHHILTGVITPTGDEVAPDGGDRVETDSWAFDPDATEGTVVDVVETGEKATAVVDRNDHGARLHTPPSRVAGNGHEAPLVGLDATGRRDLWATAFGEDVTVADIHDTDEERAAFLEDALDLRVLQAADQPRSYEGNPQTKDTDGDAALLQAIADEYSGVEAPRQRGDDLVPVGNPAAVTTKDVRALLENDERLDEVVAEWENYGNVTGANDLGKHRLAAVLGSQHYGDDAIERFCALAGREVDTSRPNGRGAALGYGDDLANTYLKHMREDQTMQAVLRFARGDSGATVVARTSALRPDLPVVGRAQVVETWSDTATAVAREYRRLGGRFTVADVADAVDATKRHVRRVLSEFVDAGYVRRLENRDGVAGVYEPAGQPGAGEVDLPDRGGAVDSDATPRQGGYSQYYTWNVRVSRGETPPDRGEPAPTPPDLRAPPSPAVTDGVEPPG